MDNFDHSLWAISLILEAEGHFHRCIDCTVLNEHWMSIEHDHDQRGDDWFFKHFPIDFYIKVSLFLKTPIAGTHFVKCPFYRAESL